MRAQRLIRNGLLVCLLLVTETTARRQAWVSVETNLPEAAVWIDSTSLGPASQGVLAVEPGRRRVSLVPPESDTWLLPRPHRSVTLAAGDTALVSLPFPYVYQIRTSPFGASAWLDRQGPGRFLGTTPLLLTLDRPLSDSLLVEKPGYLSRRVWPGDDVLNRHHLHLEPDPHITSSPPAGSTPASRRVRGRWVAPVAAGWAVASAAVAIHYKSRADLLYDRYRETGDPSLRPDIRANDLRSAIALGSLQLGVGVLAIKLVFY